MAKKKKVSKKLKEFSFETRLKSTNAFKEKMLQMFKGYVKAIIMFGSITRGEQHGKSDVDVYMIFDDTKMPLKKFDAIRDRITNDMYKVARSIDPRLHAQPVIALTEYWDGMRKQNPVFYTLTRDGYAVYDAGFFIPIRKLLEWGKFPATKESVYMRMESVPKRLQRARDVKRLMIAEDVYYSMLDAAQAVLMYLGVGPPAPGQVPNELRKHLVDEGLLDEKYVKMYDDVYKFRKKIEYKEFRGEVTGKQVDDWLKKTDEYIKVMTTLLKKLELARKAEDVKRNYEIMLKASIAALKSIGKLPEDPKELPKAFKEHLIEGGKISPIYAEVFGKVVGMRKMLDDKKLDKIPERDIYANKEYVRRFVLELRRIMESPPGEVIEEAAEEKMQEAKKKLETAKEVKELPADKVKKRAKKKTKKKKKTIKKK